ncbi:probable dolichyl-diphosphooligosaccharide--protein glycosyltransferase subunit 3 [Cynara cardunculus var. scolymus]|uniref:probable dolichyl-diphosphooligosaccharide--protein glycosyltransferase subunit 3 n=1 Tax=Cynara cardunculus var. scolymus TaxID=59895 RepID=UPI000D6315B3|nr:probable dolichyl-diphosphooligosaccharide--protein glycosyltransferase subunit 3 [Cynara cardunculus var. scolymus]
MAISPKSSLILLLILTILTSTASSFTAGIVSDLYSLQSHFPSGVIHLNDTLIHRIFSSGDRSFYLIIFFDAIPLRHKPESNLKSIKAEFDLIAKSFLINNHSSSLSKIFFCDIEFTESQKEFLRFGVQSLPNVRIVPPDANVSNSDSIPMEVGEYSTLAESMAEFIEFKTGITIGKIHHPPILSKTQLGFLITGFLIWMPFMTRKVLAGNTLFHNKRVWMFGTLFVYFFSVSGSMFILIRRIPLFIVDRKDPNKAIFFYKGNGMQFGFECISVGFLFTIVGLLLAFITRIIVKMKDSMVQRATMISALIVSFWAVREVVILNHWKTGYAVYAYLPSSWYT